MFFRTLRVSVCALGIAVCTTAPVVDGATPVFLDGFESGDLCAWQGTCPAPTDVAGTWIGSLSFPGGVSRTIVLQLHPRVDGDLLGYMLGTSESWVMRSGTYAAGALDLELALQGPSGDRIVTLSGPVNGGRATLTLSGDLAGQTVSLIRWPEELVEHRFAFADSSDGLSNPHFISMAVVLNGAGELVAGAWAGSEQKPPWDQDGGVNSFSIDGDMVTFGLDLDGGCSDGSVLDGALDSSIGFYTGSFNLIDCSGSQAGTLLGGFIDGTTSADVTEVLSALAAIADQLESGAPFPSPTPRSSRPTSTKALIFPACSRALPPKLLRGTTSSSPFSTSHGSPPAKCPVKWRSCPGPWVSISNRFVPACPRVEGCERHIWTPAPTRSHS